MEEKKQITLHPRRLARELAKRQLDMAGATGYSKVQIRNTLYNCGEGSMMCLGAIYDVIKQEQ